MSSGPSNICHWDPGGECDSLEVMKEFDSEHLSDGLSCVTAGLTLGVLSAINLPPAQIIEALT